LLNAISFSSLIDDIIKFNRKENRKLPVDNSSANNNNANQAGHLKNRGVIAKPFGLMNKSKTIQKASRRFYNSYNGNKRQQQEQEHQPQESQQQRNGMTRRRPSQFYFNRRFNSAKREIAEDTVQQAQVRRQPS
jgi:hypothetical protein